MVRQILPGGAKHTAFDAFRDRVAKAAKGARRPDGTAIPVILRLFHANSGGWFWWGDGSDNGVAVEIVADGIPFQVPLPAGRHGRAGDHGALR